MRGAVCQTGLILPLPTYTRLLQQSGYSVGHYGKWHLGNGEGAPEPFAYGIDECCVNVGKWPAT